MSKIMEYIGPISGLYSEHVKIDHEIDHGATFPDGYGADGHVAVGDNWLCVSTDCYRFTTLRSQLRPITNLRCICDVCCDERYGA